MDGWMGLFFLGLLVYLTDWVPGWLTDDRFLVLSFFFLFSLRFFFFFFFWREHFSPLFLLFFYLQVFFLLGSVRFFLAHPSYLLAL